MTGYSELADKTKYQILLQDFEERWFAGLSSHFQQKEIDSTNAQLSRSKMMLDAAETIEDCKAVESRIKRLDSWIYYTINRNA